MIDIRSKVSRLWWALAFLVGCSGASVTTTAAQTVYGAQLDNCVRTSTTRDEYEACKAKTQAQWAPMTGFDAGAPDGGK